MSFVTLLVSTGYNEAESEAFSFKFSKAIASFPHSNKTVLSKPLFYAMTTMNSA